MKVIGSMSCSDDCGIVHRVGKRHVDQTFNVDVGVIITISASNRNNLQPMPINKTNASFVEANRSRPDKVGKDDRPRAWGNANRDRRSKRQCRHCRG